MQSKQRNAEQSGCGDGRRCAAAFHKQRPGLQIFHVEAELILPISGVERRSRHSRSYCHKGRRHVGAIGQDNGKLVVAANPPGPERIAHRIAEGRELATTQVTTLRS